MKTDKSVFAFFKSLLKTLFIFAGLFLLVGGIFIAFLVENIDDSLTYTDMHAFTSVQSCTDAGHLAKTCQSAHQQATQLDSTYQWTFPDPATCGVLYGTQNCVKSENGWAVNIAGFGWVEDDNKTAFPLYPRREIGFVASNSYPVALGTSEINSGDEYLENLTKVLPLHDPVCVRKNLRTRLFDTEKYTRETIVNKFLDGHFLSSRYMTNLMKDTKYNCRLYWGLVNGEAK